jgi:hypothetical protein
LNFRAENRNHSYGVAFGAGSWVGIDQFGLVVPNSDLKDPLDRQFFHSGQAIVDKACRLARDVLPGPYGLKGSARRRKFCDRVASIATDMEANL